MAEILGSLLCKWSFWIVCVGLEYRLAFFQNTGHRCENRRDTKCQRSSGGRTELFAEYLGETKLSLATGNFRLRFLS